MSNRSDDDAPILDPELMSAETPAGIDRRELHRAVRHDRLYGGPDGQQGGDREGDRRPGRFSTSPQTARQALPRPRGCQEVQGAGDDHRRGVRQGGPRTVELAHHRADADHVQTFYRALRKAADGPTRQGHRPQGALFGSLSATGEGHGTERAALAGIIGKEPATVDPKFLDDLAANPDQTFPAEPGIATFNASIKDIIYDSPKGDFPHPNTMTCKLMAGDSVLLEQENDGRRWLHRMEGVSAPEEGPAKYPYATWRSCSSHVEANKLSVAQVVMANEVAVSGKSEEEINAFLDKIAAVMVAIVKTGLAAPESTLPGPIKLETKAGEVYKRSPRRPVREAARGGRRRRRIRSVRLRGECSRPLGRHRPYLGSAGVITAVVHALGEKEREKSCRRRDLEGLLRRVPAAVGCLSGSTTRRWPRQGAAEQRDRRGVVKGGQRLLGGGPLAAPARWLRNAAQVGPRAPPRDDLRSSRRLRADPAGASSASPSARWRRGSAS